MSDSYFRRVAEATPSRLWVNNPTEREAELALGQGARGCTTNPTYAASLLRREPEYASRVVEEKAAAGAGVDPLTLADRVQRHLVERIAPHFLPLYEQSGGREGLISLQGSPLKDHDPQLILESAWAARAIAPNVTPKLPATVPGLAALEVLVEAGSPCIVTEVFSLSQLIAANEAYLRASARTSSAPPFLISPITGILGDHLRKLTARGRIDNDAHVIELAGVALARRCYQVVTERSYPCTLLFGGARTVVDFVGLVGGRTANTINYSTIDEILVLDPAIEDTINQPVPSAVITELRGRFADFRRGWELEGLIPDEFEEFGPVQHFRDSFVAGWTSLLDAVIEATSRSRSAVG
ncbi:MAG TPA: transaldolase family protein [Acidimicrobiales bacterium]|nr:transaldolase family protein [Acidimicrobiales bacterium]